MPTLSPYPGLRPFNDTEAIFFKGRDTHIELLTRKLEQNKFLMVSGSSGDGKSSLIYAGLIPNLLAGFIKTKFTNWKIVAFRPGRNPLDNLAISLARAFDQDRHEYIVTNMRAGYSALVDLYKNTHLFCDTDSPEWNSLQEPLKHDTYKKASNLLIIADQFEEFFTNPENYNRNNQTPSASSIVTIRVFQETVKLARATGIPIFIICTIRSDFIGQCTAYDGFPELVAESEYFVPRLNRYEIMQAIEEPAILNGNRISKRLVNRLLNDVGSGQDVLPILQHCLFLIWKMAGDGKEEMDLIQYAMVGGMDGNDLPPDDRPAFIEWFNKLSPDLKKLFNKPGLRNVLNIHADSLFENLTPFTKEDGTVVSRNEMREAIEITFRCLTKIDDNRAIRNPMTLEEITATNNKQMNHETVLTILNSFRTEGNNFIYPFIGENDENKSLTPETNLDITHEALIRNWQRLDKWVWDENKLVTIYHEFTLQLNKWLQNNKSKEYLMAIGSIQYFESAIQQIKMPFYSWLMRYMWSEGEVPEAFDIHYGSYYARRDALQRRDVKVKQHLSDIKEYFEQSKWHHTFKRRFEKVGIVAISILLIASLVGFFIVLKQNKEKTLTAKSIEIATKAQMVLENNPTLAFRLAEESYKIYPTNLAKQVLMNAYGEPPFYKELSGHISKVVVAKFSPDGNYILTAGEEDIRLWTRNGNLLKNINEHKKIFFRYTEYNVINFSPDSKYFLTAGADSVVRLWDIQGNILSVIKHTSVVKSVSFSPLPIALLKKYFIKSPEFLSGLSDNEFIILTACENENTVRLWNFQGKLLHEYIGHKNNIIQAIFSPNSKFILTTSKDSTAILWNLDGNIKNKYSAKSYYFYDVCFSHSSSQIGIADPDTHVKLWNIENNQIRKLPMKNEKAFRVKFSPNDSFLVATHYNNKSFLLFDHSGNELVVFPEKHNSAIWYVNFSPDSKKLVTCSDDGTARIWDTQGNQIMILKGHKGAIIYAEFSPDGKKVITASDDFTANIWNIDLKENVILSGHSGFLKDCDFSMDGNDIITCASDYTARIWNFSGTLKKIIKHTNYAVNSCIFCPHTENILTTGYDEINIWNKKGVLLTKTPLSIGLIQNINFSPEGQFFTFPSSDPPFNVFIYDSSGKKIQEIPNQTYPSFISGAKYFFSIGKYDGTANIWKIVKENDNYVFKKKIILNSPDIRILQGVVSKSGRFITGISHDSTIYLWDTAGKLLNKLQAERKATGVKIAPNDSFIVFVKNKTILVKWDFINNSSNNFLGHTEMIPNFDISNNSKNIVSCSLDFLIKVWDLEGNIVQNIASHNKVIIKVLFSKNDDYILSISEDHTARLTPWRTETLLHKINIEKVRGDVMEFSEEDKKMYGIK